MIKKIAFLFIVILSIPVFTNAGFFVPAASLTIVVNTQVQDGSFHLDLRKLVGIVWEDYNQFDLQTTNLIATEDTSIDLIGGGEFSLREQFLSDWNLSSVDCSSDNPADTFNIESDGVVISANFPSNIRCNFNNTPVVKKTPVLIVPGVLGTEMFKNQTRLWASILRMVNPSNTDSFMDPLAFNDNLSPSDPEVFFGSIIDNPDNLYNYSEELITEFQNQNYIQNQDLFTFPYDWRFGVSDGNVNSLKQKIQSILDQTGASKVQVIAHSTGGLIVKKYVIDNPNNHNLDKAVFVGVPNLGAPKAIKVLVQGDNFGVLGLSDSEMKKLAQNMPVVYDLAPSQKYYDSAGSFFTTIDYGQNPQNQTKVLNYEETNNFLINRNLVNPLAINQAKDLHSANFDTYDIRNNGVDLYTITGCQTGTFDKVKYSFSPFTIPQVNASLSTSGDGTVPMASAGSIPASDDHKYYAPKSDHGKLLSADGIRQLIVNLATGSSLATKNIISQSDLSANPQKCKLKGKWWQIFSPLNIEIIDQNGNRAGITEDGSVQNDIPGADFEVFGERKFVYVPTDEDQAYTINLAGTGNGTFTLKDSNIDNGQVTGTQVFANVPVTTQLEGTLTSTGVATNLNLDKDGNGTVDQVVKPSSVLNPEQSKDLTAPVTRLIVNSHQTQPGVYVKRGTLLLIATDPIVARQRKQTSGVLNTTFSLDNKPAQIYTSVRQSSINFHNLASGTHSIKFFSTDKAGNVEQEQTFTWKIN